MFRLTMGKGRNHSDWQIQVETAYQEWKRNEIINNIKNHFNSANENEKLPECLRKKQLSEDKPAPLLDNLTQLRDTIKNEKKEDKEIIFVRDKNEHVTFLGSKIEVSADVADDEQVSMYTLHFIVILKCTHNVILSVQSIIV